MQKFYRGLRAQVSLLLANGHVNASRYPIARVWYEAQLVTERVNNQTLTEVTLLHAAMVAIMSPKGDGVRNLNKLMGKLRNGN